jgi:uncharacterized protein YdeI (YjbR/CyaY-like superfamily)
MNLYKALALIPKAKTAWNSLTPAERRNFVAWIDTAKTSNERGQRINTVCMRLKGGKRHFRF